MSGAEIKWRVCHKILIANGFVPTTCNGSHQKYVRDGKHIVISHLLVNRMLWRRLVKENNLKEV